MFQLAHTRKLVCALFMGIMVSSVSFADATKPFFEKNVNRWGSDYSVIDVKSGGADTCYQACARDKQCLAWTYHKPGTRSELGQCFLKSKVAKGRANPCCTSGVLVGQGAVAGSQERSPVITNDLAKPAPVAAARKPRKSFFRMARLMRGERLGLREITMVALAPPLKITPVSYGLSEDL